MLFGFSLLFHHKGNRISHRILAVFLLVLASEDINVLLHSYGITEEYPVLANIFNNFGVLFGVLLFFYTRSMTDSSWRFSLKQSLHLFPLAVFFGYNIWFYHLLPFEEKLAILHGEKSTWSDFKLPLVLFGHAVILSYTLAAFYVLRANGIRLRQLFSYIEPYELSWLRATLMIFFILWAIRFSLIPLSLLGISSQITNTIQVLYPLLILCAIANLTRHAWFQHQVFSDCTISPSIPAEEKPGHLPPNSEQFEKDGKHLQQVMQEHRLWKQPGLTLAQLAKHLHRSPLDVSELLNAHLQSSFFDYINHHRCQDAAEQISTSNKSILEAAFAAGFSSKTAFNRAFKKEFGMTPSQYRQRQQSTSN